MEPLNFKKIINNRKKTLKKRIAELDSLKSKLTISEPVEFSVSDIAAKVNARKKGEKVGVNQLNFLEEIKCPIVYVYEIVDNEIKPELLSKLAAFRSIENKDEDGNDLRRSTAKIPMSAYENTTNILYVGSVKEYIHSRTRQHLGHGHPKTFALQLKCWALPEWKFRFYYIELENKNLTTEIEAALSAELKPLVGKQEK